MSPAAPLTVLVPAYRGVDDVRRCLDSVLRHAPDGPPFELLVIDDASPEPELVEHLEGLAAGDTPVPVQMRRNQRNRGFVATVNAGMAAVAGDVVILNADTVVTAGWLERLAGAGSGDDVATVTPLTNFGSICTLPRMIIGAFELDSEKPDVDGCGAFVARHSLGLRPEVITGVGFCMYVTRRALELCGDFDEAAFGQGYGEEVDFCLRASRVGLRHLVEDSTFVYHRGGGSFGPERAERMAAASAVLHSRYRFFRDANARERSMNPLSVPFAALELGLDERRTDRPHVLHLLHSSPGEIGGTEMHLRALLDALRPEFDFSILYPVESGFVLRSHWTTGGRLVEREILLPGGPRRATTAHDDVAAEALRTALDLYRFDAVHVQNLIGHSLAPLAVLADFPGPVLCSVRDLYLACPNHSLLYRNQQPCGIPEDLDLCARCLPETRDLPVEFLGEFRATVADHLDAVDHWVFASQSAADYFLRVYEPATEHIDVIPHGAIIDLDRPQPELDPGRIFDEPLRLAFVGRGWAKKGLALVNALADAFASTPVEVHHFGELKDPPSPELHTHGTYDHQLLPELLHRAGIQVVLLPGPYAETFGHVMTEALVAGLPVVGAGYGALGERIRELGAGWTIDPMVPEQFHDLVERLDACRGEVLRATRAARAAPVLTLRENADRYATLYRSQTAEPVLAGEGGDRPT